VARRIYEGELIRGWVGQRWTPAAVYPPEPRLHVCRPVAHLCPQAVDGQSVPQRGSPDPSDTGELVTTTVAGWMPHQHPASCASRSNLGRSPSTPPVVESPCEMDCQPVHQVQCKRHRSSSGEACLGNLVTMRAPCSMRKLDTSHPLAWLGEWPVSHIAHHAARRCVR
jgi:hypothetical protein